VSAHSANAERSGAIYRRAAQESVAQRSHASKKKKNKKINLYFILFLFFFQRYALKEK
jgi:hypothetical protein